jgi:hypothetical protein
MMTGRHASLVVMVLTVRLESSTVLLGKPQRERRLRH